MQPQKDKNGNIYFDIGTIHITCIKKTKNGEPGIRIEKNWIPLPQKEGDPISIEIPIPDKSAAFDLLKGIYKALEIIDL